MPILNPSNLWFRFLRTFFPFEYSVVPTPVIVTVEEPTFVPINVLEITKTLPEGLYVLTGSIEYSMPDTNDSALFRIVSPLTQGNIYRERAKDAGDLVFRTISSPFYHAGGAITFTLEASKEVNSNDLTVSFNSITFECKERY